MWTRRDLVCLAVSAVATFGLTVTAFYPRLADAVDQNPAPTATINVPTLNLGTATVSAALDPDHNRTVIFTVRNPSDQKTTARFQAAAMVSSPPAPGSRGWGSVGQAWHEEYAVDLLPNETQRLSATLPDGAFGGPSQFSPSASFSGNASAATISSYLTLSTKDATPAQSIQALKLVRPGASGVNVVFNSMFGSQMSSQLSSSIASSSASQWQAAPGASAMGPGPRADLQPFSTLPQAVVSALPIPNPTAAIPSTTPPSSVKLTSTALEQPIGPVVGN
jgi:hypothetical protein